MIGPLPEVLTKVMAEKKPVPGVRFIDGFSLIFNASHFFRIWSPVVYLCFCFHLQEEEKAGSS